MHSRLPFASGLKALAAWLVVMVQLTGSHQMHAQDPFLLRKDIVVAQQFGSGATGGPTTVADFNRDGRPDIAVCTAPGLTVLLNLGSGAFGPPLHSAGECGTITGDFNSDGRLDLIAPHGLHLGRGDGPFAQARALGPQGMSLRVVVSGDFNGDRKPDLVFYTGPTWSDEPAPIAAFLPALDRAGTADIGRM